MKRTERPTVLIVATGGTIEALDYPKGKRFPPEERDTSVIPNLLEKASFGYPYRITIPFMKDSRFLTDEDLELLLKSIVEAPEQKVLVSHGTMTLSNTHAFLQKNRHFFPNKTIVLFGANIASNEPNSDAGINLGFALGCCLYAEPQVYIAMNGLLLKALSCKVNGRWVEK